jgi:hypothetical protein
MELNVCAKGKLLEAAQTLLLVPPPALLPSLFTTKWKLFRADRTNALGVLLSAQPAVRKLCSYHVSWLWLLSIK